MIICASPENIERVCEACSGKLYGISERVSSRPEIIDLDEMRDDITEAIKDLSELLYHMGSLREKLRVNEQRAKKRKQKAEGRDE